MNWQSNASCCAIFVTAIIGPVAIASDEKTTLSDAARQTRVKQIRRVVESLKPTLLKQTGSQSAQVAPVPAMLYADNSRDVTDSSLWIWELDGKPIGVAAVEWNRPSKEDGLWTFEYASWSTERVQLTLSDGPWRSEPVNAAPQPIREAPAAAATRPLRLQQMKRLAERFAAVEFHHAEGRIELRRLPTPVYRQAEPGDSAVFVFANGTNPEVLLWIAHDDRLKESQWSYALGACSADALVVTLDGQEVWSEKPFTGPGTRTTYVNGRLAETSEQK